MDTTASSPVQAELAPDLQPLLAGVRILAIMPSIPVFGMERANLQVMKMMRERGADVLFVTNHFHGEQVRAEVERIACGWANATIDRLFHIPRSPLDLVQMLYSWLRGTWQIDQIYRTFRPTHIYVTNWLYALYAWPTLRRTQQAVIFRLPEIPDRSMQGIRRATYTALWRYIIAPVCDLMVCDSNFVRSELQQFLPQYIHTRRIYNCLPERQTASANEHFVFQPGRINIVYVGQIREHKGIVELFETALRIVRERDNVDFFFAGDYSWQNRRAQEMIELIRAQGLEQRICFLGSVQNVFGLLAQSDIHVCPSLVEEAFGLVVLEAKSQAVPSVVFPSGGLKETVQHLIDGYICREKSTQALYEGICYYLDRPEARRAAGIAARESLAMFDCDQIAARWVEIFQQR